LFGLSRQALFSSVGTKRAGIEPKDACLRLQGTILPPGNHFFPSNRREIMNRSLGKREGKKPFLRRLQGFIWVASLCPLIFTAPVLSAAGEGGRSVTAAAYPDGEKLQTILKGFEQYAEKGMKDWGTPGMAVAIVKGEELICPKGFGVRTAG
jgi:hypothetical protein